MKKLLLAALALVGGMAANAAQWAVVGGYSNWNFSQSKVLTASGNEFVGDIASLTDGFKIVDIENNNWDTQYGTSTLLELGVPLKLNGKNGGADPSNIGFAGLLNEIKNAHVVWNATTETLTITGEAVYDYPALRVAGAFPASNWNLDNSPVMAREGDIYTATIEFTGTAEAPNAFKLVGPGWSPEYCGAVTVDAEHLTVTLTRGGADSKFALTGKYCLTFNISTLELKATEVAGLEAVDAATGVAEYYNILGVRVDKPVKGMYIKVQNGKATKVLVK